MFLALLDRTSTEQEQPVDRFPNWLSRLARVSIGLAFWPRNLYFSTPFFSNTYVRSLGKLICQFWNVLPKVHLIKLGFNEIVILMNKPSFQICMRRYVNPKCTHAFILHLFPMNKGLPNVLILYPLGHLMNFQINTWDYLQIKPISNLTIVCYHQNLIRKTLGLTKLIIK